VETGILTCVSVSEPPEIGIGVSPAFGRPDAGPTMSGLTAREVVVSLVQGVALTGCGVRMLRVNASVDVVRIAWEAAQSATSGIGIGVLAKGTTVLHRADRSAREILELSPPAPLMDRTAYRSIGTRAARLARGEPVTVPDTLLADAELIADVMDRLKVYGALERRWCTAEPPVEDLLSLA